LARGCKKEIVKDLSMKMSKIVLANYCMRTMCGAIDNHALAVGGMFKEI